MQQKLEKRRGNFGAGLFASVALHVTIAALLLFRLPPAALEPEREEIVKVEMVPEPEKKPEKKHAEKQVEEPARQQAQRQAQKPAEKPPAKAISEQKPAEARRSLPQAFESASREGEKDPAAGMPSEDKSDGVPDAASQAESETSARTGQQPKRDAKSVETAKAARPPELSLPQTETVRQSIDEGTGIETTLPTAETAKPETRADGSVETAIVNEKPSSGRPNPASEMKKAKEIYSADALSDPRIRQALGKLPKDRRIAQMCMIEALEQIRRASPDTVPEGLFFDPPKDASPVSGQTLNATGAAYRSGQAWYDIDFQCTVNDEADAITAFNFVIGGAVAKGQWKARGLPND